MQAVADFTDLLQQFMGGNPLYLLSWCAGLLLVARLAKEGREVALVSFLIITLMVFNPGSYAFLTTKYGFQSTYYRFLWLVPNAPLLAYMAYEALRSIPDGRRRLLWVTLICAVVVLCYAKKENFKIPDNIYMMSQEVVDVGDQLKALREAKGEEYVNVIADKGMSDVIREYDAHVILKAQLYGAAESDPARVSEDALTLMSMATYDRSDIPADAVWRIADNCQVEYVIAPKACANFLAYMQGIGWQIEAETAEHAILGQGG